MACCLVHRVQPMVLIGSPAWSSPERLMGKKIGPPNDVFAFAVVACGVWIDGAHAGLVGCSDCTSCKVTVLPLYRHYICLCRIHTNACTQAWECLTTLRPWAEFDDIIQIITAITVFNRRLELPSSAPAEMSMIPNLICDCWQVCPCPT